MSHKHKTRAVNRLIVALLVLIVLLLCAIAALLRLRHKEKQSSHLEEITTQNIAAATLPDHIDVDLEPQVETEPELEDTEAETEEPMESVQIITLLDEPEPEPEPEPESEPEPIPEAEPEEKQEYDPDEVIPELNPGDELPSVEKYILPTGAIASGRFASITGTALNLDVKWELFKDTDGVQKVALDVALVSYSLKVSDRAKGEGLSIWIDGKEYTYSTPKIIYTGQEEIRNRICSAVLPVSDLPETIELHWRFMGSYSGREMNYITAIGTISLDE